jgi:hypothetical protein
LFCTVSKKHLVKTSSIYYLKSNKSLLKEIKSAGKYKWAQEKENKGSGD